MLETAFRPSADHIYFHFSIVRGTCSWRFWLGIWIIQVIESQRLPNEPLAFFFLFLGFHWFRRVNFFNFFLSVAQRVMCCVWKNDEKKCGINLPVQKIGVTLHSLSGNNAGEHKRKERSLTRLQWQVVQENNRDCLLVPLIPKQVQQNTISLTAQ